jgi:hypothetical protein
MANASDLPFLLGAIALAVVVTGGMFFLLKALKANASVLRVLSASAFPGLLVAIIVYVQVWNPDPHGFVMAALSFLALLSLPVTILTTTLLAQRFA